MTETNLKTITKKVSQILYAEWAYSGAMGCAGTARVYIMDVDDLIQYVTGMGWLYDELYDLINDRSDKAYPAEMELALRHSLESKENLPQYFKSAYGGYGNLAWKNNDITLRPDDENNSFIYYRRDNDKYYRIRCSVRGVYERIRGEFAHESSSGVF